MGLPGQGDVPRSVVPDQAHLVHKVQIDHNKAGEVLLGVFSCSFDFLTRRATTCSKSVSSVPKALFWEAALTIQGVALQPQCVSQGVRQPAAFVPKLPRGVGVSVIAYLDAGLIRAL